MFVVFKYKQGVIHTHTHTYIINKMKNTGKFQLLINISFILRRAKTTRRLGRKMYVRENRFD